MICLISSPVRVSYSSMALARLCSSSRCSVSTFFAATCASSTIRLTSPSMTQSYEGTIKEAQKLVEMAEKK